MNSVVELGFKVVFYEKNICGSYEQCTRPIIFLAKRKNAQFLCDPNACITYSYKLENIIYKCKLQNSNHII